MDLEYLNYYAAMESTHVCTDSCKCETKDGQIEAYKEVGILIIEELISPEIESPIVELPHIVKKANKKKSN